MGYVETAFAKEGTALNALVRGKAQAMQVTRLPFVKPNYYRG